MIPRSQGHCYLQRSHCHHHCSVWPETGGNPRCCPGPQGPDLHCSRNRRLGSQGWHKSRGWRHHCHPQRWVRAECGTAVGWPACPRGNPLGISVTRRSRPLEASGPPCWPGRACDGCKEGTREGGLEGLNAHQCLAAPTLGCLPKASCGQMSGSCLHPKGEWGWRVCFQKLHHPVCKRALSRPVAQPGALLVSNIFQNDPGKE